MPTQTEEEHQESYIKLRHAHSAVESKINSLEHHGVARSRDKGYHGYARCTGLGVLAYNLHQIGKGMLRKEEEARTKAVKKLSRQIERLAA